MIFSFGCFVFLDAPRHKMNTNKQNKTEYSSKFFESLIQNFESLKYSLLDDNDDILLDNSSDPDLNLFSKNTKNLDTRYLLPGKLYSFLDNYVTDWFSILYLNIRSFKKNVENFKLLLPSLEFFSVSYVFRRHGLKI